MPLFILQKVLYDCEGAFKSILAADNSKKVLNKIAKALKKKDAIYGRARIEVDDIVCHQVEQLMGPVPNDGQNEAEYYDKKFDVEFDEREKAKKIVAIKYQIEPDKISTMYDEVDYEIIQLTTSDDYSKLNIKKGKKIWKNTKDALW
ncbi:MAG: hypothetical protein WC523_04210 [Patescibacteria group bacterium]